MQINWAALHKAAENSDIEMMQYLVDHGADVNVRNNDGITPLLHSVRLNNVDAMEFLLKNGANPDIKSHVRVPLQMKAWALHQH